MKTTDKVILITGGGKGIGRECAKLLAKYDNFIIITGRSENALKKTVHDINAQGYHATYYVGDVTNLQDCNHVVSSVIDEFGRLDILINNAGMSMRGLFKDTTLDLFKTIMDINFIGAVNMCKYAIEYIEQSQGQILFISSLSGLKGLPGIAPYSCAKMALTGFADSLRCEVYEKNVHVGIIYVGFTENDVGKKVYTSDGKLVDILRKANHDTQISVANSVLKCIEKRKDTMVLTNLGKITKIAYQYFPLISGKLLKRYAAKKYNDI